MKRKILASLILLVTVLCIFAVTASAEATLPEKCEACDKAVEWKALDEKALAEISATSTPTLESDHYYLAFENDSCDVACLTLGASKTVCLYLNGKTLNGTTRAFVLREATLNIMGEGTILGHGTKNTTLGGTIYVDTQGVVNQYGGTVTFSASADTILKANNGGVIGVDGTYNLHGGTVTGGVASNAGGVAYVNTNGSLNLYGGSVGSGTAKTAKSIYCKGTTMLSGNANADQIYFNSIHGESLQIKGTYTGTAQIRFSGPADGMDIGTALDNANLMAAKLSVYNSELYVIAKEGNILLSSVLDNKITAYCKHCKKTVQWIGLTEADSATGYIYTGHYYLAFAGDSCEFGTKTIVGYDQICLDLNGKYLEATDRAFHVHTGFLNIMDSVGGGKVSGRGTTSDTYGGTLFVRENGVLNIYDGVYTYEDVPDDKKNVVLRGGVAYIRGTMNMYGGEIKDGVAKIGGNVYVDIVSVDDGYHFGQLNMFGGKITDNAARADGASITGPCVYTKSLVTVSGNAEIKDLYVVPDATNGPARSEMITFKDAFTGKVSLRFSAFAEGMDIGINDGGDLSGGTVKISNNSSAKVVLYRKEALVMTAAPAVLALDGTGGSVAYADFATAVQNFTGVGYLALMADVNETLELTRDVLVDLNGFNIAGSVSGDKTLSVMDTATDDYDISDKAYGKITADATCKIVGAEATATRDGYLMIEEEGALTFHRVNLSIKSMSLKPDVAGVYFISDFAGDKMVEELVDSFGVALSVMGDPALDTMGLFTKYTKFGADLFNTDTANTSSLLYGVMKQTNSDATNAANADMTVYGRAYIRLTDGSLVYGYGRNCSFREQVEAIDTVFADLTTKQMKGILTMYKDYRALVDTWSTTTIQTWQTNLDIRDATDYTPYLSPDYWTNDVTAQAIADGKIHYYFMSGEGMLISTTQAQQDKWGDACLVVFPNGENMLIDTGPLAYGPVLTRNLLRMGITKLDYLVITHPHSDHVNGAFAKRNVLDENGFLNKIQVEQVLHRGGYDPDSTNSTLAQRICDERGIKVDIMEKGDTYTFGDVTAQVIWPLKGTGDTLISGGEEVNNMCIVIRFDYGEHSSLFTADLYLSGEESVLANTDKAILDTDFLKVPHHGYLTSSGSAFIDAISPEIVVSTGCLKIPQKLRTRYENKGIDFLDDGTRGYIHVTAGADGVMEYTTSRNDPAVDGGEVAPDVD